jgi:hypothetical protein
MPSNINGCGWIAAYNMRRALGQDVYFDDVRRELDEMFALRVPGPTTMSAMRRYMTKYVPGHHYSSGHDSVLQSAEGSKAGIFRYMESGVPHFTSYVSRPDGTYRFFNVADGLEDCTFTMRDFIRSRCMNGALRAFTAR